MRYTIRFLREREDAERERRGEEPITDLDLAGKLIAWKYFDAAEVVLAAHYHHDPVSNGQH